jgi:hypothetical protein
VWRRRRRRRRGTSASPRGDDHPHPGGGRQHGAPEGASGTVTLADGESFEFVAAPATGVEGFYPVNVTPSEVSGTSWRGAKLGGTRNGEEIAGVFTPPGGEEGEPVDLDMSAAGIEEGENR